MALEPVVARARAQAIAIVTAVIDGDADGANTLTAALEVSEADEVVAALATLVAGRHRHHGPAREKFRAYLLDVAG